jgi:hypothetical protein
MLPILLGIVLLRVEALHWHLLRRVEILLASRYDLILVVLQKGLHYAEVIFLHHAHSFHLLSEMPFILM